MARWIKRGAAALLLLVVLAAGAAWALLRGSLPVLDGELDLSGLSAAVTVQRDALGVVTIDAGNERDAMRALGYVHAQERYFEMDLMRRSAAGELAALFGPRAVDLDKRRRVHRMRARAQADMAAILGDQRDVAQAYVDGVNAGLAGLPIRPWPYLLLRATPQPWQLSDIAMVSDAMFFDLQDAQNERELAWWRLQQVLPAPLHRLLTHAGSQWDAPLMGAARGDARLPGPDELDLRTRPAAPAAAGARAVEIDRVHIRREGIGRVDIKRAGLEPASLETAGLASADVEPAVIGSNNFAVAGRLTGDGRAIVANDMHLGLRAPNIWLRARLRYRDARAPQGRVDIGGFTLPGLPAIVVGSNTHVAWGFTNSYGDWLDWVLVPADAPLHEVTETLAVKGAPAQTMRVRESRWGPVLHDLPDGRRLALAWTAHRRGALNLQLARLARAGDLDQALAVARQAGMPTQNLLIADRAGRIAWRPIGRIPKRIGNCDPAQPLDPARGCDWDGWLDADASASLELRDPASGRLWSANARVADGAALRLIGDGGYDLGARQRQIRDGLFARQRFAEADLLAIQLDDRALFLQRWWRLLRSVVERSDDPALRRLEAASRQWQGHAATDAVSYRIARGFRGLVLESVLDGLLAPAKVAMGEEFVAPRTAQFEGVLWPLVEQRPAHLLPPGHASWEALLANAAHRLEADLAAQGPDLADRSWGERNTAAICHPLAAALPGLLKSRLCMPAEPLAGDAHMPRVLAPDTGVSERMVVSPGHEADGIIHMPGGQSGHPLSPYWGAGHDDWVHGRPTPFLPGPAQHTLRLGPAAKPLPAKGASFGT